MVNGNNINTEPGVDPGTGLVQSPFTITKDSDGSTYLTADLATSSTFTDLLIYAVPLGQAVKIETFNYFFGEYKDTGGSAITDGQTRLLKANSTRDESRTIWQGSNGIFKDIGDVRQRPTLRVPVIASASQKLVVQVKDLGTTLDISESNFFIESFQIYEQI